MIESFGKSVQRMFDELPVSQGLHLHEHDESWYEIRANRFSVHFNFDRGDMGCHVVVPEAGMDHIRVRDAYAKLNEEPAPPPPANLWSARDVLNWYSVLLQGSLLKRFLP